MRPDVPVAAIDRAALLAPVWSGELLVGSAYTHHAAGRWGYVVTCNIRSQGEPRDARVALADLGEDRPDTDHVAVWDWRNRRVEVLPDDGAYDVTLEPAGWDYRAIAPVLAGGIAVIGDPALYACGGDTRIADVVVDPTGVTVTVLGANEPVTLVGWSDHPISPLVWHPAAGTTGVAATFDETSGGWSLELDVGPEGWTRLHIPTAAAGTGA